MPKAPKARRAPKLPSGRLVVVEKLHGIIKFGEESIEMGHAAIKIQNLLARGNAPARELTALRHELEDEIGDFLGIYDYLLKRNPDFLDQARIKARREMKRKRNNDRTQPGVLTFETEKK